ncbi:hypothetical protein E2C01_089620 [Portunus trituberculatus]|uniref:Ig-like domain-containing protein n=1 Tax=Portunus trituberculatus TaxID=210409 RepID=A0A5B7JHR0_PORTR|nr:hypothetical protein [Portunus trituberculatus]
MCAQNRVTVTAVEGEMVTLQCAVDAYPANVTFHWLFNNTVDSTRFRETEVRLGTLTERLRMGAM